MYDLIVISFLLYRSDFQASGTREVWPEDFKGCLEIC